jgi:uncharacterized protein YciI
MKNLQFAAIIACLVVVQLAKGGEPKADERGQFIYVLHLIPRLHDIKSWTDIDKAAVDQHFGRLKDMAKSGQVILAGRTQEPGDKTFGIVIFQAYDENSARIFMETDPAVVAGVMTAELHPFKVAVQQFAQLFSEPKKP